MHYKKIVGIDISDFSIEIVEMEKSENAAKIVNFNRVLLERGIVEKGKIKNRAKLKKELLTALAQAKNGPISTPDIVFALPDNFLYTHFFEVASNNDNLNREVFNEVLRIAPLSKKNLAFVYKQIVPLTAGKEKKQIFSAAIDNNYLKEWQVFFSSLKLSPIIFDIEVLALFRGIYNDLPKESICLLDMGANSINFAVFTNVGLVYNYQARYGGNYITEKLARSLRFSYEDAEEFKKKNNLFLSLKKEERGGLENVFTHVTEEVKRNFFYFNENYASFGKIKQLVLAGGVSETKGILDFFQKNFQEIKVTLVKDFVNDSGLEPVYFGSIGMAKRLFSKKRKNDLAFFVKNDFTKIYKNKELFYNIYNKINIKRFSWIVNLKVIILFFLIIVATGLFIKAFHDSAPKEAKIISDPVKSQGIIFEEEFEEVAENTRSASKKIKIQAINSNLNVRQGAGSEYAIIGSVAPSTVHKVFTEENGWYEIIVEDNQEGWIYAGYAEEIVE